MLDLLYFGEDGRLYINHECDFCTKYPLEDINETCLECGYSQAELLDLKVKVDKQNEAYDFFKVYTNKKEDNPQVKGALLYVQAVNFGDGYDKIVLSDLEESGKLRDMAEMVQKNIYAVFYYDQNEEDFETFEFDLFFDEE